MISFSSFFRHAFLISTLLLIVDCFSLYAQSNDTTKAKVSYADSANTSKKKKQGFFSIIQKLLKPQEKKVQESGLSTKKNLADSKFSDTTKSTSKKGGSPPFGLNPIPKSDTAKKNSVLALNKDTAEPISPFKKKINSFISSMDKASIHGTINAGYDYGVLPFASNMQVPMGYYHSDGQGQFNVGILPINASYYYSDLKSISGLNNFFRFSFDAQKFRQQYMDKTSLNEESLKNELGNVYKEKQLAEQKLLYLKSIEDKPTVKPGQFSQGGVTPKLSGVTGEEKAIETDAGDTLKKDLKKDSINTPKANKGGSLKSDSAALAKDGKSVLKKDLTKEQSKDSTKEQISKYKRDIRRCDSAIAKINKDIITIENIRRNPQVYNPYMSKLFNFMSGVKKMDIGLCYPDYSSFLVSGMAVKGINMEYEKNDVFFAATEGTTVNTLLFTNNSVQNRLVNMQNLYNMFDFQSVQNGRKIVDFKTGYGTKEGSHLFVGVLYGSGLPSYLNTFTPGIETGLSKNYVLELDGKWAITPNSSINLVYGKSSTQTYGENYYNTDGGVFNSNRSKAVLGTYKCNIIGTKTKLTVTSRWVDPYFNSYGIGYMRTDNFKYEFKVEQTVSSKIKFSIFYRKDDDNVVPLYQFRTVLQTVGTNVTLKPLRSLTLRLGYIPVVEQMWGTNPTYYMNNRNNISTALLTYTPPSRGVNTVFNLAYNYYRLTTDTQTIAYQNVTFSNLTRFRNSFNNNISVSWFKTSQIDSLNNNVWMLEEDPGYSFKGGCTIGIGGKAAWTPVTNRWQLGYEVKLHIPLIKHLSSEINAEKLVLGDFYNNFDIAQIERFPYFWQAKIIYSF